jgi:hypothetical protein
VDRHFLRDLFKPLAVRIGASSAGIIGAYDAISNQFILPKLGKIIGMSGTLLPWWGWLLVLEAILVFALFEYVRRHAIPEKPMTHSQASESFGQVVDSFGKLEDRLKGAEERIDKAGKAVEEITKFNSSVTHSQLDLIEDVNKRLANVIVELAEHKQHMSDCYTAQDEARREGLNALKLEIEQIRRGGGDLQERINTLFMALQAIDAMGREARLAGAMFGEGEFLIQRVHANQPVKGDDWKDWENHRTSFESAFDQWMQIARSWNRNADRWLARVQSEDLTSKQPAGIDELFDGSKAVFTYLGFANKFDRWQAFRSHILTALHMTAFGGPDAAKMVLEQGVEGILSSR